MELSREVPTQVKILRVLSDGKPRASKELKMELWLGSSKKPAASPNATKSALYCIATEPSVSHDKVFKVIE